MKVEIFFPWLKILTFSDAPQMSTGNLCPCLEVDITLSCALLSTSFPGSLEHNAVVLLTMAEKTPFGWLIFVSVFQCMFYTRY